MSIIQTDLLNYFVKSLNHDCALTNVNVSKMLRRYWRTSMTLKLLGFMNYSCFTLLNARWNINNNHLVMSLMMMIMHWPVFATDCHCPGSLSPVSGLSEGAGPGTGSGSHWSLVSSHHPSRSRGVFTLTLRSIRCQPGGWGAHRPSDVREQSGANNGLFTLSP